MYEALNKSYTEASQFNDGSNSEAAVVPSAHPRSGVLIRDRPRGVEGVIGEGHGNRLVVSSSEYPTLELNPMTGKRVNDNEVRTGAIQYVSLDRLHRSHLISPVTS